MRTIITLVLMLVSLSFGADRGRYDYTDMSSLDDRVKTATSAADPVIVRDCFSDALWYLYTPVLGKSNYWTRITLQSPPASMRYINTGEAAVDKGNGTVGIPCTAHGFIAGMSITIHGTEHYDNTYTIASVSANEIVITATYAAETFGDNDLIVSSSVASPPSFLLMSDIHTGIVRPGKTAYYGDGDWTEGSPWASATAHTYNFRVTNTANNYITVAIPDGYNLIYVIAYDQSSDGDIKVTWDDDTTTGILNDGNFDTNAYTTQIRVVAIPVATAANPVSKRLKIKNVDGDLTRIVGVVAYDTDGIGDPSTAVNGRATGHNLVTALDINSSTTAGGVFIATNYDTTVHSLATNGIAMEFAISMAPDGGTLRYTGGYAHYNPATNYPFYYHYNTYSDGPEIFVDGNSKGNAFNATENPLGTLWTGYHIALVHDGYTSFTGEETSTNPDITMIRTCTSGSLTVSTEVEYQGDTDTSMNGIYGIMLGCSSASATGWIYDMDASIRYSMADTRYLGSSRAALNQTSGDPSILVQLYSETPSKWYFYDTNKKFYQQLDVFRMPGMNNPADGDIWEISGTYTFMAK